MSIPPGMGRRARVLRLPTAGPQDTAPLAQQELQRERGIAAGEVVDAAVALSLADDGHDVV